MNCPWCDKPNFIPVLCQNNGERYGGKYVTTCVHCGRKVTVQYKLMAVVTHAVKSNATEDDWGE